VEELDGNVLELNIHREAGVHLERDHPALEDSLMLRLSGLNHLHDLLDQVPLLWRARRPEQRLDFCQSQIRLVLVQFSAKALSPDLPQQRVIAQFFKGAALGLPNGPFAHI
jgi:phosphoenolpyruvate carboxylase